MAVEGQSYLRFRSKVTPPLRLLSDEAYIYQYLMVAFVIIMNK